MSAIETDRAVACSEAHLLSHQAEGLPDVYRLSRELPNVIGRSSECTVQLPDESCSRRHCSISCINDRWMIDDLHSRNGTLLNGEKLSRQMELQEGDVITVGQTWLVFTLMTPQGAPGGRAGDETVGGDDTCIDVEFEDPPTKSGRRALSEADQNDVPRRPRVANQDESTIAMPRRAGDALIGDSEALREVVQQVEYVAPTDATVLLRGESGVGKELVAREIHVRSRRNRGPFVCVNCAALSESLLESELFGHERGAFTGATEQKKGKFEQAHQGTIFLDEIGEMSPTIQAKFLRVLEGHPFERVGGQVPIQVDVRVVAATNMDLEHGIREGHFRRDLYFRLNVLPIEIPPLRARTSDIPPLAEYFIARFARQIDRPVPQLTEAAIERLCTYPWPGNVRELKNTIERAVVLCRREVIDAGDLAFTNLEAEPLPEGGSDGMSLDAVELQHILRTLRMTRWNKAKSSRILGIERSTLDRKLKRNNIERPEEFGGPGAE